MEIASLILSGIAIIISILCVVFQIAAENRMANKQKILDECYKKIYEVLPKIIDGLLKKRNIEEKDVLPVKNFLCDELRPLFGFMRFTNPKKYDAIRNKIIELEDVVCLVLQDDDYHNAANKIETKTKELFKEFNKCFKFNI